MNIRLITLTGIMFLSAMMPMVFADVYVNVMAVNGASVRKETPVKYNLPGDLTAQDILDTNGLELEYNVNDANYYVHGTLTLDPKESKTFRIRVKDIWKVSADETAKIKEEIDKGFEQIGKAHDPEKAQILRQQLTQKLDYIVEQQVAKADSVEKRMDAFRTYRKEVQRIRDQALAVDYWRSEPGENKEKIIRFKIEVENPLKSPSKTVKQKHYLPVEIKPEDVVEAEGFEVRFDQRKEQSFLFKEEEIPQGQKKVYSIGIRDIWSIAQKDIDYLRHRADYAYDFLKNSSQYAQSSKFLYDHANALLKDIEDVQAQTLDIKEHISAFRINQKTFENARTDVENLEKLLSIYRENLEKSKVQNVLQKVRSLKGIADIAKQALNKKMAPSTAWRFIGWTLVFVAFLTLLNFIVWIFRSRDKKKKMEDVPPQAEKSQPQAKH